MRCHCAFATEKQGHTCIKITNKRADEQTGHNYSLCKKAVKASWEKVKEMNENEEFKDKDLYLLR